MNCLDEQWQGDLADLQSLSRWSRGYKYLLTYIDVSSKYAWVVPLKSKSGAGLVATFTDIGNELILAGKLQLKKLQKKKPEKNSGFDGA